MAQEAEPDHRVACARWSTVILKSHRTAPQDDLYRHQLKQKGAAASNDGKEHDARPPQPEHRNHERDEREAP